MDTLSIPQNPKRKNPEDYHALAASRGMKWIGPYPGKVSIKTTWECPKGHRFELCYTHLRDPRYGCAKCAKWQPEDYEAAAFERGITWLGLYPSSSHKPTRWRCSEGHEWEAPLHSLQSCNVCAYENRSEALRLMPEDYHALAAKFGVTWLGPEVRNSGEKTNWRCEQGHEWSAQYRAFRGCTVCNYPHRAEKRRNTPEEYHALAAERGLVWLGPEVTGSAQKTKWQCSQGHIWETSYSVIRGGCGCRACSYEERQEAHRLHSQDYYALAARREFTWLGPEVRASKYHTQWQCSNGHTWEASYNNIEKGSGCPFCLDYVNGVRVSEPQKELAALVDGVLNYKVGRLAIDVALPALLIALEYDCYYWHWNREAEDKRRAQKLVASGWRVLRVKGRRLLPTLDQLSQVFTAFDGGQTYQELILADWGT
jgi:hypothetical protein